MNTYFYAKYEDGENTIEKMVARSLEDCEDKIVNKYMELYDDIDDSKGYDSFIEDLDGFYGIIIGRIYESDELN